MRWILTVEVDDYDEGDYILAYVEEALAQIPEGSAFVLNTENAAEDNQED